MSRRDGLFSDQKHPQLAAGLRMARSVFPPVTFISLHYAYFLVGCLISSVVFWASSGPDFRVGYVDSLFLVVSAMTETGLNTVNLSRLNMWQQVMLFMLTLLGGQIWVSIWTVVARKHAFEKHFDAIVADVRAGRRQALRRGPHPAGTRPCLARVISLRSPQPVGWDMQAGRAAQGEATAASHVLPGDPTLLPPPEHKTLAHSADREGPCNETHPPDRNDAPVADLAPMELGRILSRSTQDLDGGGRVVFADRLQPTSRASNHSSIRANIIPCVSSSVTTATTSAPQSRPSRRLGPAALDSDNGDETEKGGQRTLREFLDNTPSSRGGHFFGMSSQERDQLGGCEYRALKILVTVVPLYFVLWQMLGCVALGAWIAYNQPRPALDNDINPWWLGVFNGASAFNNSGLSLLDANLVPFDQAPFLLITMGLLILAGNTAYPICLRLILWTVLRLLQVVTAEDAYADLKATLDFILKYPRRVYTNLFPSRPTWWLLFMVVLLNSIDWVAFELLNLGNPVIENIPKGARVLDGLFQAIGTSSAPLKPPPPALAVKKRLAPLDYVAGVDLTRA